jgi:predicted TPR repeat methyltransferase
LKTDDIQQALDAAKKLYLDADFVAAEKAYDRIFSISEHNEARHMLGLLAIQQGRYDKAKLLLEEAVLHDPLSPSIHNHLANVLASLKEDNAALQHYQLAIESDVNYAPSYNNLGNFYRRMGEFDKAIETYEKAIEKDPHYDDAHYNLGFAYLQQEDFEKASHYLGEFVAYSLDEWRLAKAQYQLGHIALNAGRYEDASIHYQACLHADSKQIEPRKYLAFSFLKLDKINDAIKQFSVYLNHEPYDLEAHYNLGVLLQRQGAWDQAFYHFSEVVKQDPIYSAAHNNLGVLCLKQGRKEAAILHFEKALHQDPSHAGIQYILTALRQGDSPTKAPAAFIEELYDSYAGFYDKHMLQALDYQVPQWLEDTLKTLWPLRQDKSILELGCGTGLLGKILRSYASFLEGIDLSAAMLKEAEKKGDYHRLQHGDFHEVLEGMRENFDLIVLADALIYTGDLQSIMSNTRAHLKLEGYFILTCELTYRASTYVLNETGRYAHSEEYIKACLHAAGYRIYACKAVILRHQAGQDVEGLWIVAQVKSDNLI